MPQDHQETETGLDYQSYLSAIVESSLDAIISKDFRSLITSWNRGAEEIFGYSAAEMIGSSVLLLIPADRHQEEQRILDSIRRGQRVEPFETIRLAKDGSSIDVSVSASPIRNTSGEVVGIASIVRDINAKKDSERELVRLTRLYSALNQVNQAVASASTREELFQRVCRVLVERGGFGLAQVGWFVADSEHPELVAQFKAEHSRSGPGCIPSDKDPIGGLDLDMSRPIDSPPSPRQFATMHEADWHSACFPIDNSGKTAGLLTVSSNDPQLFGEREKALVREAACDISIGLEKLHREELGKRTEQTLRIEKDFSDTMIASMPGILYFYDSEGHFLRWNRSFEEVSEYTGEEIARMHPLDFFSEAEKPIVAERIEQVLTGGMATVESGFLTKSGKELPHFFTGRRVEFNGKTCLVGVGIDVSDRKAAEEKLQESEHKYRELVELANSIILRWDTQGRITFLNEYGQRFFGYTNEEIIGKHVVGTIVPEATNDGRNLQTLMEEICANPAQFEENVNENVLHNGDRVIIAWTNRILQDADGNAIEILSVGTDITARQRAEAARRESEARYRTLFEYAPDGIVIATRDGVYIDVNAAACRMLGYSREEFIGLHASSIVAHSDVEEFGPALTTLHANLDHQSEWRFLRKDGTEFPAEVIATQMPDGNILAMLRDISDRKAAEMALHDREERLSLLLDSTAEAIYGTDLDGICTFANRACAQMLGYASPSALIGVDMHASIHRCEGGDDAGSNDCCAVLSASRRGKAVHLETTEFYRADGKAFIAEFFSYPIIRGEKLVGSVATFLDVTKRIKLEEQLRQAQKTEAIGRLAGGIAHDFNNILSIIIGYTDFALDSLPVDAPLHNDIQQVRIAADKAAALTRQLLAFSRKQMLKPEVLDIDRLVGESQQLLQRLIGEDIEIEYTPQADVGRVRADASQLEQVILNLAVNARDAMPKGGRISIQTSNVDLVETEFEPDSSYHPGPYVQISMTDTGCGMDSETLSKVFEPFFTTKSSGKGTGLGLATVYGIVEQSGGHITVESEIGVGTTFRILLPRVYQDLTRSKEAHSAVVLRGAETILLVEDEFALREMGERVLENAGYRVLTASNGGEALQVSKEFEGCIDLVLTDVVMPHLSGRDLAVELVKSRPAIRVLYMSGFTDDAIVHHEVFQESVDFIGKPFTAQQLTQKIRDVLNRE